MMHVSVILFVLALNSQQSALQAINAKAIEAAKNTDVHQIEPSLPSRAFARWLRDVAGPQAEISWEVNDCGEQTGDPSLDKGRDFPMCAEAQVTLGGKRKLHVVLPVGTFKTGIRTGPASFFYAVIVEMDGSQTWIKSLSRLPEAIKTAK
jgi:hypothetical protein